MFSAALICRGRYFDGFFSRPSEVSVRLTSKKLTILFSDGRSQEWEKGRVVNNCDASILLASDSQRLSVDCSLSQIPGTFLQRDRDQSTHWVSAALLGFAFVWFLVVANVMLPWSIASLSRRVSPALEYLDAYERFERMVERTPGYETRGVAFCVDTAGSAAFARLTAALTAQKQLKWKPEVVVIRNREDRAVALGAGLIVITSGFLFDIDDQAELAAILAHEIGHNELESQSLGLVEVSSLLGLADFLFGSTIGRWGTLLVGRGNYVPPTVRQGERMADQFAIERLREAGIDGGAYAKSLRLRGDSKPSLFSTHPPRSERARMYQAAAQPGVDVLAPHEWLALKSICRTTTKTAPVSPPEPS